MGEASVPLPTPDTVRMNTIGRKKGFPSSLSNHPRYLCVEGIKWAEKWEAHQSGGLTEQ